MANESERYSIVEEIKGDVRLYHIVRKGRIFATSDSAFGAKQLADVLNRHIHDVEKMERAMNARNN